MTSFRVDEKKNDSKGRFEPEAVIVAEALTLLRFDARGGCVS